MIDCIEHDGGCFMAYFYSITGGLGMSARGCAGGMTRYHAMSLPHVKDLRALQLLTGRVAAVGREHFVPHQEYNGGSAPIPRERDFLGARPVSARPVPARVVVGTCGVFSAPLPSVRRFSDQQRKGEVTTIEG